MKTHYTNLEKKLGVNFKDKKLLVKSLTHKSFDNQYNNEKIEFLGDRVLDEEDRHHKEALHCLSKKLQDLQSCRPRRAEGC